MLWRTSRLKRVFPISVRPGKQIGAWLALSAAMFVATGAHAQVIEIADDGEAVVFSGPGLSVNRLPLPATTAVDPFESAAARTGVDVNLLRIVAWKESRGNPRALSPKGAMGVMQLMPATAAALGVDPRDPVANIHGGATYLARQIAQFGTIPLALAAYNAGPGAVRRYGGIPPYAETRDYVDTIMRRWSGIQTPLPTVSLSYRPARPPAAAPSSLAAIMLIEVDEQ